jgi:hypothetical protein
VIRGAAVPFDEQAREQTGKEVGMRPGWKKTLLGAAFVVPGLAIAVLVFAPRASQADEPSRLSRLFRFGGGSSNANSNSNSAPAANPSQPTAPGGPAAAEPAPGLLFSGNSAPAGGPAPRLVPQPRVSRPATESDPILTRIALARTTDGSQFGMALQIFADGTVIDSEGVHHLRPADLKPILDVLQSGDLYRLKGHCGSPATDSTEQIYMVVYERSLGRLRANAFSYSGNPQGCDHAVRHLHNAIEAIQQKLSRTAGPVSAPAPAAAGYPAAPPVGTPSPAAPAAGPSISLTPQ